MNERGLRIFAALGDISDTLILDSAVPLVGAPVTKPTKGTGGGWFSTLLSSPLAVAGIVGLIAVGVVTGVAAARYISTPEPPVTESSEADGTATDPADMTTADHGGILPQPETDTSTDTETNVETESETEAETLSEEDAYIESVLENAEPMTPDVPEGSTLCGEVAMLTAVYETLNHQTVDRVGRVAVYRAPEGYEPLVDVRYYMYRDILNDEGGVEACETVEVFGLFFLAQDRSEPRKLMLVELGHCNTYEKPPTVSVRVTAKSLSWRTGTVNTQYAAETEDLDVTYEDWLQPFSQNFGVLLKTHISQSDNRDWFVHVTTQLQDSNEDGYSMVVDYTDYDGDPYVYTREAIPTVGTEDYERILSELTVDKVVYAFLERVGYEVETEAE